MPVSPFPGRVCSALSVAAFACALTLAGAASRAGESSDASTAELRQRLEQRLSEARPSPAVSSASAEAARPKARPAPRKAPQTARAAATPAAAQAHEHRHDRSDGHGAAHWSYAGEGGPQDWGALHPEFRLCGAGQRQSPIDIRGGIPVDLTPIRFDYRPSGFNVVDNGHTVQVNVGAGNTIELNGRRYELAQFHFHRPSEERVNGRAYDMVAHLVHKDLDGRLAVVAVLLEQGRAHPVVQQVWNSLPLERHEAMPGDVAIDLATLLPEDRRYYTYMGSLTTPPCTEGVLWLVLKQPVALSPEQIGVFARLYPMNARPVQPAQGRMIKESN